MTTAPELRRLVEIAVLAGDLPSDPFVLASCVNVRPDTACSLCTLPLGSESAFELRGQDRRLLHAHCASAWVDVVVAPKYEPSGPN